MHILQAFAEKFFRVPVPFCTNPLKGRGKDFSPGVMRFILWNKVL